MLEQVCVALWISAVLQYHSTSGLMGLLGSRDAESKCTASPLTRSAFSNFSGFELGMSRDVSSEPAAAASSEKDILQALAELGLFQELHHWSPLACRCQRNLRSILRFSLARRARPLQKLQSCRHLGAHSPVPLVSELAYSRSVSPETALTSSPTRSLHSFRS